MSNLVAVSDIPTLAVLYKLGKIGVPSSPQAVANQTYNQKVSVIRHDITKLKVDAIVNAANGSLMGGGGVDKAIHDAAGPDLVKECATLDGCDTGSAKITNAYKLPCKKVIHAVGPVYSISKKNGQHTTLLQGCYRTSLELAVENNLKSIAFSALSTGVYGYPSDEAAETAIAEVKKYIDSGKGDSLERIIFCNFMEKDQEAYRAFLPQFFPPTEEDFKANGKGTSEAQSSKPLQEEKLPDPPKAEPGYEDAPNAKKQKLEHRTSDDGTVQAIFESKVDL